MNKLSMLAVALLITATGLAGDLPAIRCGRDIVKLGASKFEVLAQCGEPTDKMVQEKEIIKRDPLTGYQRRTFLVLEFWLYNYGPRRFFDILVFETGRFVDIKRGGYGFERPIRDYCKAGSTHFNGDDLKPVVRMKCGDPSNIETYYADRIVRDPDSGEEFTISVRVDEWLYNFGSREFMNTLRFEDGMLVSMLKGNYGFD